MKIIPKIITIISFLFLSLTSSYAEDYSKGNSNPFQRYKYSNEFIAQNQSNQSNEPTSYFTNQLQNPIKVNKNGKYRNLINSSLNLNGCWDKAGAAYNVDPWLLFSIAKVESGFNHQAININKNNSMDIGLMQINSIWLPTLQKFGIDKNNLFEPCTSVFVGAWIVAQNIKRFGYNQDGIGAYNSPRNIVIRRNYARKVYSAYNELTHDFGINVQARK